MLPRSVVYNVLVGGFSVGLTFHLPEAQAWAAGRSNAKILTVPYRAPTA